MLFRSSRQIGSGIFPMNVYQLIFRKCKMNSQERGNFYCSEHTCLQLEVKVRYRGFRLRDEVGCLMDG